MMAGRGRSGGVRLLPAVMVSLAALAAMKGAGLVLGERSLSPISVATAQDAADAAQGEEAPAEAAPAEGEAQDATGAEAMSPDGAAPEPQEVATLSESERAVLENLRARRETLEERERSLVVRENLLRAAEQRIDTKVTELRALEESIRATLAEKEEADDQQLAGLVTMYETMKPKAAAVIFDRMEPGVLVEIARRMTPESLGEVVSRMDPVVAEQVTRAIAQAGRDEAQLVGELEAITPE